MVLFEPYILAVFSLLLGLPMLITAENIYKVIGSVPEGYREEKKTVEICQDVKK